MSGDGDDAVAFSVQDFHDLVRLLEQHPEWRAELRRLTLTDELLGLPAVVQELAEAQRRTEQRVEELAEAQRRTEQRLEELAEASGARNVTLSGRLSQPALNEAYASASAMLSLSEHEGFCVPLLEAFHFDLPVVARPAGGMPEVGGDAVLWVDDPDLATVSELLDLAVRDRELREELGRRGRRRLAEYSYERTSQALRSAVDAALA